MIFRSTVILAGLLTSTIRAQTAAPPVLQNYARLPLAFEKQAGSAERFVARGQRYIIGLETGKATIGILSPNEKTKPIAARAVSLEFSKAMPSHAKTGAALPGKVNYIHGNDRRSWALGLPAYDRVEYDGVYPGIDVVYYGNQQQLEFDLVVKAGADPGEIRMKIGGARKISIDGSGALNVGLPDGDGGNTLKIALPKIYQNAGGGRKMVTGRYAIERGGEVAFRVDAWDRTRALVIDPTIVYSTLLGGGTGSSSGYGVAVAPSGNIVLTGYTFATDFPLVNAAQTLFGGSVDGFVSEINAAGTALIYSTYLGGASSDVFYGVAVDSDGSAWVAGNTVSNDFPLMNPLQSTYAGGFDAIVVKLNSSGALQFSSYLGGNGDDSAYGVAVGVSKAAYITGYTTTAGSGFPTTSGVLQSTNQGGSDAFVVKINTSGKLVYSTLLGGSGADIGQAVAVDPTGSAYVTGSSSSSTFAGAPTGGAQTSNRGSQNAFVAKLNSAGAALQYFTFFGGTGTDQAYAIAVDASMNAVIGGQTTSTGLATAGVVQTSPGGANDGFVAKLNTAGTAFTYATYLGGSRQDYLKSLALDGSGNAYVAGYTNSTNFPVNSALDASLPGNGFSLFQTTNSAASWSGADSSIPGAVVDVSVDPTSASTIVVATESGIYRTIDGGSSWTLESAYLFSDYVFIPIFARSPVNPAIVYAMAGANILKSTDGGVTWNPVTSPNPQISGIIADALDSSTAYAFVGSSYAGGTTPLYKTTDGGATWAPASTGLPASAGTVGTAEIQSMVATADGTLYLTYYLQGVYKSADQGATWNSNNTGLVSPYYFLSRVLSAAGNTVYVTDQGTVYTTTTGATTWSSLPASVGTAAAAVSADRSTLYALLTDGTVRTSTDGGKTWSASGSGLPANANPYASALVIDPTTAAHVFLTVQANVAAFVAKLNSTGSALTWSTYLGTPSGTTYAYAVATDGKGDAFVTGYTAGQGFPVNSAALPYGPNSALYLIEFSDTTNSCAVATMPGSAFVPQSGGTVTFSVVAPSGCAWSASSNQTWLALTSGASGIGTGTVTVRAGLNSSGGTQSAVLMVGNQNINITQASGSCSYSVDRSNYPLPVNGGPITVTVTSQAACPWVVTNNYPGAVSITTGASGMGNGTIQLTVGANPAGSERSLFLPVGTAQISIAQAGVVGTTPQTITFGALSNVSPTVVPFTISATASSGQPVSFQSSTLSVCTVSGNTVTIVSSGGCSITATQVGDTNYAPAPPVTQNFTVLFNDVQPLSVDPGDYYYNAVNLFAQYGITAGCGGDNFCLYQNVTRAQMAVFVIRAIFGNQIFSYQTTPHFNDVQPTDFGFKWIQAMYELGISAGCGNGNYCPNDPVTRDAMSVFIITARLGAGVSFNYPATPWFTDVPASDFAFKFVQRMKSDGITGGCTTTTFCPGGYVTRGQMAVFMMVGLFNQFLPAGTPVIASISPQTLHPGTSGTFTITGANTNFTSATQLNAIPGVTIGAITVNSATSLTVQMTAAADAVVEPRSLDAITGTQEAVLPSGLLVQ
jgi:Beta-propeller repeat/S-layer homology domain